MFMQIKLDYEFEFKLDVTVKQNITIWQSSQKLN